MFALLVAALIGIFLGFLLLLYLKQGQLIFVGTDASPLLYKQLNFEEIRIPVDGAQLQGWKHVNSAPENNVYMIYFGGNAEDVATFFSEFAKLDVAGLFSFNYRGYALSSGVPSEKAIYADALNIYDFVKSYDPKAEIIVMGRSLGSAVAGYVSAHRDVSATILITPLKSISALVKEVYPFLPVKLILKHPFYLDQTVKQCRAKTFVLIAEQDEIIPRQHSMETYQAIPTAKELIELKGVGHNDVFTHPRFIISIGRFVNEIVEQSNASSDS